MDECNCRDCRNRKALTEAIKRIKRELPKPEYDWEDLERRDKERRARERCPEGR